MSSPGSVEAARGAIREGVAALLALEQLVRSPRVGPRPLQRAFVDSQGSCDALNAALDALAEATEARFGATVSVALGPLLEDLRSRVAVLHEALGVASDDTLSARLRLGVEAELHGLSGKLGALHGLANLLAAASAPRPLSVHLSDVLDDRRTAEDVQCIQAVVRGDTTTFEGDPRVTSGLVEIAAAVVRYRGGQGNLVLTAEPSEPGHVTLRIRERPPEPESPPSSRRPWFPGRPPKKAPEPRAPEGPTFHIPVRAYLPAALETARALAAALGIGFTVSEAGDEVTLFL